MKNPTNIMVSVIVPAFNVVRYLDRCVESVLGQSFPDFEIILLDDGSVDGTAELCKRWEETEQRIRSLSKKNEGQGPTRDIGIRMAMGKYIFFLDADDWIVPECLERLVKTAEETMADIVIFDYYLTRRSAAGNLVHQPSRRQLRLEKTGSTLKEHPELLSRCGGTVWNKLQRRDFIQKNKISHPSHKYEDISYVYQMLIHAVRIVHLPELLYYYWINRVDSTTNEKPYISECFMALEEMQEIIGGYQYREICFSHLMKYSAAYLQIPLLRLNEAKEKEIRDVWTEYYRRYPMAEKVDRLKFMIIGSESLKVIFQRTRFLNMAYESCSLADVFYTCEAREFLRTVLLQGGFDCLLIDFGHLDYKETNSSGEWQSDCRLFAEIVDEFWKKGDGVFLLETEQAVKTMETRIEKAEQYFISILPEASVLHVSQSYIEINNMEYYNYEKADELRDMLLIRYTEYGEI